MQAVLWVFLGGGLGSLARFGIARALHFWGPDFPFATLIANVVSCILLGYLMGQTLHGRMSQEGQWLLMTGFCGGFSTFSTFSGETYNLLTSGHYAYALLNMGGSLFLGLICIYLGLRLSG
jgi:CrcB protein